MEKIVIGVPYEISIEPSVDIGKFESQLIITEGDLKFAIDMKPIKGSDNDYTFTISSKLKSLLKKKTVDYSIFVFKENARFEVDDGKLQFIDESDFKVRVTDNAKMHRKEEEPEPTEKPKKKKADKPKKEKTPEPTPTEEPKKEANETVIDPIARAEALVEKQNLILNEESVRQLAENIAKVSEGGPRVLAEHINSTDNTPQTQGNLKDILKGIEERKKKQKINESIRNNLKK